MRSGGVELICDEVRERWQILTPSFSLSLGTTGQRQLAILSFQNRQTGTEWIKVPVPFFGFGTKIDNVEVNSLTLQNGIGSFALIDAQQRRRDDFTELSFQLKHHRLNIYAAVWLKAFEGSPVMETGFSIRNEGAKTVEVSLLNPLVLTIHTGSSLKLLTLTGGRYDDKFPPSGFVLTENSLHDGGSYEIFCGDEGRSSAKDIPWFALGLVSESGEIVEGIVGGLEWSGRWRGVIQRQGNSVTVKIGATELVHRLSPGSEIHSPSAFLLLFSGDWDEVGWQLHQWQEKFLCPPAPPNFPWVQFNSWFGWTTKIDGTVLMREVDIAADLGCEVFVVDAGWYEGCGTGDFGHGLGNWTENRSKFPNGLKTLSDYTHKKGMKFGLWVEPERIDLETELAKQHPDWLAMRDGKIIGGGRYAHICFGNPQVVEWFRDRLSKIVAEYGIDWLKWDYNIAYGLGCNATTHGHQEGDGTYAHTLGVYAVKSFLREKFPHLVIEGCASGGNRIDFGILKHTHTYWLSDFTHRAANVRFHLTGAWFALPPRYLNTWVVHEGTSIADFRSRMGGAFGLSPRLTEWDEKTKERARKCIAEYKRLRPFVLKRRFLLTPQAKSLQDWTVWQFHDPETDNGAILAFREQSPKERLTVRLKGLKSDVKYELRNEDTGKVTQQTGEQLLKGGLTIFIGEIEGSAFIWISRT